MKEKLPKWKKLSNQIEKNNDDKKRKVNKEQDILTDFDKIINGLFGFLRNKIVLVGIAILIVILFVSFYIFSSRNQSDKFHTKISDSTFSIMLPFNSINNQYITNINGNNYDFNFINDAGLATSKNEIDNSLSFFYGNYIPFEDMKNLLSSKKDDYKYSLNSSKQVTFGTDVKNVYPISTIIEQDFGTTDGKEIKVKGTNLIFVMKSKYVDKDNPQNVYKFTKEEQIQYIKSISKDLVIYLRSNKNFNNIPKVITIFQQAEDGSSSGGEPIGYAKITNNDLEIKKVENISFEKIFFTLPSSEKYDSNTNNSIKDLRYDINKNFNLFVTTNGEGQYTNHNLDKLTVNVNVDIDSKITISALAKYLQDNINKYFGNSIVTINILFGIETRAIIIKNGFQVISSVI